MMMIKLMTMMMTRTTSASAMHTVSSAPFESMGSSTMGVGGRLLQRRDTATHSKPYLLHRQGMRSTPQQRRRSIDRPLGTSARGPCRSCGRQTLRVVAGSTTRPTAAAPPLLCARSSTSATSPAIHPRAWMMTMKCMYCVRCACCVVCCE